MHQLQPKFLREILSTDADTAESDGPGDARSRFEEIFGRPQRTGEGFELNEAQRDRWGKRQKNVDQLRRKRGLDRCQVKAVEQTSYVDIKSEQGIVLVQVTPSISEVTLSSSDVVDIKSEQGIVLVQV